MSYASNGINLYLITLRRNTDFSALGQGRLNINLLSKNSGSALLIG